MKSGFWPRYCPEDVKWQGYEGYDFVAYPMVCFCDIPLSRIDEHVGFYGEYGLGLTKEWAERNNATPLQYVSNNNFLKGTFKKLINSASKLEEEDKQNFLHDFRYLLAYTKPTQGNMVVGGQIIEKEFYQESEWRCVPKHLDIVDHLTREKYDDKDILSTANALTLEHCKLEISPSDIKYVFVKNDSDIPNIINFIQTELDHFTSVDIKILMSRVVSLESIQRDM
jgi:hypothetical protein